MKKIIAILLTTALLAALTGCDKTEGNSDSVPSSDTQSSTTAPSEPESSEDGVPESSDSAEINPGVPEKRQPDGEPTFLTGLDGEPIYTSEITQIFAFDPEIGESVQVDRLDRESFSEAVCEGFTYVYTPRPSVDFMSNPELFEANEDGDRYYYIGEGLPVSREFIRVNVGDEVGGLTVKAASSLFEKIVIEDSEEIFVSGAVEFDGELELTGYVVVSEGNPLYPESGGYIWFYPDSASNVKIPTTMTTYAQGAMHYTDDNFYGWYGEGCGISLGNIADIDSELREGDMYVKVRVVVGDIIVNLGAEAVIREIELI